MAPVGEVDMLLSVKTSALGCIHDKVLYIESVYTTLSLDKHILGNCVILNTSHSC